MKFKFGNFIEIRREFSVSFKTFSVTVLLRQVCIYSSMVTKFTKPVLQEPSTRAVGKVTCIGPRNMHSDALHLLTIYIITSVIWTDTCV